MPILTDGGGRSEEYNFGMACPLPDCESSEAKIEVRYGAREIDCPSCGKFKMADNLFEAAPVAFASQRDSVAQLRGFIQARNGEGKIPVLTAENWRTLAAEQSSESWEA